MKNLNSYKLGSKISTYVVDPYDVGGHLPVLVTGISQSGDLLGYISGIDIDGICSGQYNKALLLKHDVEQIQF